MAEMHWIRKRLLGLLVGWGLTVLTVAAYLAGWLGALERVYLDYNFKHWNQLDADPRIVMVDINDLALERISRWPWPRKLQAELVRVLNECGAKAILLDLVYSEPTRNHFDDPRLDPSTRRRPNVPILTDPGLEPEARDCLPLDEVVEDDIEMASAIEAAGDVYVAMFFRLEPPAYDLHRIRAAARALMDENPNADLATFAAAIGPHDAARTDIYYMHARMDHLLRKDFGLTAEQLADKLNMDLGEVRVHISRIKEVAARFLVNACLQEKPDASETDIYNCVLPGVPSDLETPDHADLYRAYYAALAARHAFAHALPPNPSLDGIIPNGGQPTMPIFEIASVAKRVGFVSFDKEADGVVRHIPLLARTEGHIIPQIAFALAMDMLDIDTDDLRVRDGHTLVLHDRSASNTWRIPLAADGTMLLNWHVPRDDHESGEEITWDKSFTHIPVAFVMEVALNREDIRRNEATLRKWNARAVDLMYAGAESAYLDYESNVRKANALRKRLDHNPRDTKAQESLNQINKTIAEVEKNALANLDRTYREITGLEPQDEEEKRLFAKVRQLYDQLLAEHFADKIADQNKLLQTRIDERLADLGARIKGKICFVGHTASAQADMVNTPVYDNMPGVMAHANLLNTLLQNRIPRTASAAINVLLILLTGVLITLLTCSRGPWVTFFSVLVLMGATWSISSMVIWPRYIVNVAALIPIVAAAVIWALITLHRQLTEMRHRRSLARELSRNTSPAIAAQITEHIENFELTPRPANVTCYFSDLQGFTHISEHLGVERTTAILNSYLGAMGEVLIEYRAFNKFMGDGIFAFFNAPIWPVEDHARVGCESALVTLAKLEALKKRTGNGYAAELSRLWMRVGLHTGPVFVGYFGSENQTDYTCIGDTVNLASRLESANKALGTQILVSGACREAAGGRFEFRSLGALQVAGKAQAVPVFELLGRAGEVAQSRLDYAARFAEAVEAFQNQHWEAAASRFQACISAQPGDLAAKLYLLAIEQLSATPPPPDWNQAIELRSK